MKNILITFQINTLLTFLLGLEDFRADPIRIRPSTLFLLDLPRLGLGLGLGSGDGFFVFVIMVDEFISLALAASGCGFCGREGFGNFDGSRC